MIHAKPFRINRLQADGPSTADTEPEPDLHQIVTRLKPDCNQIKLINLRGKTLVIIQLIVEELNCSNCSQIADVFQRFCKAKNLRSDSMDTSSVSSLLNILVKQNRITRIKIKGMWYYFPINL